LLDAIDGARLLLPVSGSAERWGAGDVLKMYGTLRRDRVMFSADGLYGGAVVFDMRETPRDEFRALQHGRLTIGLDESGPVRECFDLLVDTFPRLSGCPANIENEGLVAEGSQKPPRDVRQIKRVLVSFGGEDPFDLTDLAVAALDGRVETVDVVRGPAFRYKPKTRGVIYSGLQNIRPLFREYDAVVTSFGLTAYEASREGVLPLIVNPTVYHDRLTELAGFESLGVGKIDEVKLCSLIHSPPPVPVKPEASLQAVLRGLCEFGRLG
jgi:hypothetical protein